MARTAPPGQFSLAIRERPTDPPRVLYDPQPRQDELHRCKAPNILYGGQAGGGKSHALRWHLIMACARLKRLKVLLLRRQFVDLQRHHLLQLPLEVPRALARYNANNHELHFAHTESVMVFGHCQYESDIGAYLSSEWDIIAIDEGGEFTPRMLRMLRSRVRTSTAREQPIQPQFMIGTNPGGEGHLWIKQRFFDKTPPTKVDDPENGERNYNPDEWVFIPSTLEDNEYLDKDQYEKQFSSMSDAEYRAYRKGDWEAFAGQFFSDWRKGIHMIPKGSPLHTAPEDWHEIMLVMDWGWNPNPGYVGWAAFDPFGVRGYKEFTFNELSASEAAEGIARRCTTDREQNAEIVADPTMWLPQAAKGGVSIAVEMDEWFADNGHGLRMVKGNNDRLLGWQRMKGYLRPVRKLNDGTIGPYLRFLEYDDRSGLGCPYLLSTIGAQLYDDRMNGDMKKGATDHACFVAGTMIATPHGERAVEVLQLGDIVLTRRGPRRILATFVTEPVPVVQVQLDNGRILRGTPDHWIWFHDFCGWTRLDELMPGDILTSCLELRPSSLVAATSVDIPTPNNARTNITSRQELRIGSVASNDCTKKSGKQRMGRFLATVTSITEIVTRSITRSKTWSVCHRAFTSVTMRMAGLTETRNWSTWPISGDWQHDGTVQRTVDRGTEHMGLTSGEIAQPLNRSANTAVIAIHRVATGAAFAPTTVRVLGDAPPELITSRLRVSSVDELLSAVAMREHQPVLGHVVVTSTPKPSGIARVYNLTVEGEHEYFANGVLVSNCDAWRYGIFHREPLVELPRALAHAPTMDERRVERTRAILKQVKAAHNESLALDEDALPTLEPRDPDTALRIAEEIAELWQ